MCASAASGGRDCVSELSVRPMGQADIPQTAAVTAPAFQIDIGTPRSARRWRRRIEHSLVTDPEGAFVAVRSGRIIGAAQALRRERLWCLSLLAVDPSVQSGGAGRALLARTLSYREPDDAGLIVSSNDPRALRLYARAGFWLQPTFEAAGPVDRRALPRPHPEIRSVGARAVESLAEISRAVRGAPHTVEILHALERGGSLLRLGDRGFAVTIPGEGVWLLAARDDSAATALLWSALELVGETSNASVRWITGAQDWAVRVVVSAGLRVAAYGALCVSGHPGPLRPFLPSPPFA